MQMRTEKIVKEKIIWENPNPTQGFNSQSIDIAASANSEFEIYFIYNKDIKYLYSKKCTKDYGSEVFNLIRNNSQVIRIARTFRFENNKIIFDGCTNTNLNSTMPGTIDNNYFIPVKIVEIYK